MLCAWLPVEAAMMPFCFSSSVRFATRFIPPRTLNAPVGSVFSHFTKASHPNCLDKVGDEMSGVLGKYLEICFCALYTSLMVIVLVVIGSQTQHKLVGFKLF